jgi:hypothetical protein
MKHLLFLDLKDTITTVQFPDDLNGQIIDSARLLTWSVTGIKNPEEETRTDCFYLQLRFEGGLQSRTISHGSRPDMFPLPILSVNDWSPTNLSLPLPVTHSNWLKRFTVTIFQEGESPILFEPEPEGMRLLLWIELETHPQ